VITGNAINAVCRALLLVFAFAWTALVAAQVPDPPLAGHINDLTGTLTAEQKATLEQTLVAFEAKKGSQLAVLMVATTAPEEIEQYALRVAEKWKLGRKRVDDGVIVVVAKNDRAVRIEVGYGLEGALTDVTSKRIISETMLPRFKEQDFFGGITAAVEQIIRVVDGEPLPAPSGAHGQSQGDIRQLVPVFFIVALAVGGVLRRVLGKVMGSVVTGGVVAVIAWFALGVVAMAVGAGVVALLVTLLGGGLLARGVGGYYGGMGGGGFSGGGGGFGGGGASGRW
jgi:uncharacterized protein